MAEHLNGRLWRQCLRTAVFMAAAGACTSALAQSSDPTQPPSAPQRAAPGVPAPDGALVLNSVLISQYRREAVIGGKLVRPGDPVGNARVVEISESQVVLRNEKGLQTLKLFPGMEKRYMSAVAGTPVRRGNIKVEKNK